MFTPVFSSASRGITLLLLMLLPLLGQAQVVISQVYGGGGNGGATYNADYVEIFNRGNTTQVIDGWSLQYASSSGNFATGTFLITFPASTSIAAGKYLLVRTSPPGAPGAAVTSDFTSSPLVNMSATAGKVALANNSTPVTFASGAPTGTNVVDFFGFSNSTNTANASETTPLLTTGINSTQALLRKSGGCTDANNNSTDFVIATAAPRNAGTAANLCTTPTLLASPTLLTGFSTVSSTPVTPSAERTFSVSGTNLSGGDVTVTAPANYEVSKTSGSGFGSSVTLSAYTGTATSIYVRLSGTGTAGTQGTVSTPVNVQIVDGATTATVGLSGTLNTAYYSVVVGSLENLNTFNTKADGSGTAPASFTANFQTFFIIGTGRTLTTGSLTISGTGSKAVLTAGAGFIIPAAFNFTGPIDLLAASTLTVQNAAPGYALGTVDATSTVNFAQNAAAGSFGVPAFAYGNLTLTGGTKTFASGTTTVRGNLIADGVTGLNGPASSFATVDLSGNFTLLNGTTFNLGTGSNLITLRLLGNGTQTLTGNGSEFFLFRLIPLGTTAAVLASGGTSNVTLGNTTNGGLSIDAAATLALNDNTLTLDRNGFFAVVAPSTGTGLLKNVGTGKVVINHTGGTFLGTLRLAAGETLGKLTLNATSTANTLSILTGTAATSTTTLNALDLTAGTLIIGAGNGLVLNGPVTNTAAGFLQGSATSSLSFTGNSPVSGSGSGLAFTTGAGSQLQALTLNQTTNTLIPVAITLTIGTLTLTKGSLLFSGTNRAIISTLSGGNNDSFVNALTLQTTAATTETLLYPLGAALNRYRPLTFNVTQTAPAITAYTARVTEQNTNSRGVNAPITRVSARRYFTVSEVATTNFASGTLTLSFSNDTGDGVTDLTTLRIARSISPASYNDVNPGSTPTTTGTAAAGTIADVIAALGDFALATTATDLTINPLPVVLTSFSAQRQADAVVVLSWTTASEQNSAYFEVQRSLDGRTFLTVATAAARGTSTQPTSYAAQDKMAPAAASYYRLRQVDTNGQAVFSQVVTVAGTAPVAAPGIELTLYPNPTTDRLTAALSAVEGRTYRVLNALGQVVSHGSAEVAHPTVEVRQLPAGLYFLELRTATGSQVRRFVKND